MATVKNIKDLYDFSSKIASGTASVICQQGECSISSDTDILGIEIHFTGKVNIIDIHAIYQRVDYLIFPSLLESLGLPLIEAKLHDLPIICSRRDYVFDVCEPLLTFNPENIEEIKKSLKEAVEISLLHKGFS